MNDSCVCTHPIRTLTTPFHVRSPRRTQVGKPVTSPKTNLVVQPKDILLHPNVTVRSLLLEFKEATTREWEEAEQRWREQSDEGEGEGKKDERRWADVAGGGRGGVEG